MDYLAALSELAGRFTLIPSASTSPLERGLALQAPADAQVGNKLVLPEVTQVLTFVDGPATTYNVDYAFRNVRFASLTDNRVIGGLPIGDLATLPGAAVMHSLPGEATNPGVPGVIGTLTGVVTTQVEKLVDQLVQHPVEVETEWSVLDTTGTFATGFEYNTGGGWLPVPAAVVTVAPLATPGPLNLRFPIVFSHLTSSTPAARQYVVRARIRLSVTVAAARHTGGWTALPDVPLIVPTIPIPVVLALFENRDYQGRAFVCVPSNSVIGATDGLPLASALELVKSALSALLPASSLLGFFTSDPGLRLASLAPTHKQVVFASASIINDLSQHVIDPGGVLGIGRLTGEDMASSIIFIGPPGAVADMFAERDRSTEITPLQLTLPQGLESPLGIAITRIDKPAGQIEVTYGGDVTSARPERRYEDIISSLELHVP